MLVYSVVRCENNDIDAEGRQTVKTFLSKEKADSFCKLLHNS